MPTPDSVPCDNPVALSSVFRGESRACPESCSHFTLSIQSISRNTRATTPVLPVPARHGGTRTDILGLFSFACQRKNLQNCQWRFSRTTVHQGPPYTPAFAFTFLPIEHPKAVSFSDRSSVQGTKNPQSSSPDSILNDHHTLGLSHPPDD